LVIITTAYPEFALEGFELDVIDYLVKPIPFSRFFKAVQRAKEYFEVSSNIQKQDTYFFVRSEKRIEKFELKEILYIESLGNYVTIHTEAKKIITYLTLKGIEAQLPTDQFIKVHHSFIVNLFKITAIEGNEIKLKENSIPISRSYKDQVMQIVDLKILKR
jgi:DNA-binding LytR/AlgR family response regulator